MPQYNCIVIGGSFAGLSAALSLGRASCKTLIIDNGQPINAPSEKLHNLIGWDGMDPHRLKEAGLRELLKYDSLKFLNGYVNKVTKESNAFTVELSNSEKFTTDFILLATGMKPQFPDITDFEKCWGKTILHCPYCHGYEFKNESTAILGEGESAFDMARLLLMWTKSIVVFTNGGKMSRSHINKLEEYGIKVENDPIQSLVHNEGILQAIVLNDNRSFMVKALYYQPQLIQHSELIKDIGCKLKKDGLIDTDVFQSTSIEGIYAAGDNCAGGHSVASAISTGSLAGIFISKAIALRD